MHSNAKTCWNCRKCSRSQVAAGEGDVLLWVAAVDGGASSKAPPRAPQRPASRGGGKGDKGQKKE